MPRSPLPFVRDLVNTIPLDTRRVCLAGRGVSALALRYAEAGSFVSVVSDDSQECAALESTIATRGLRDRATIWDKPYMAHNFEMSGIDALAVYDGIQSGDQVLPFFKKVRREIRAGGTIFAVQRTDPDLLGVLPERVTEVVANLSGLLRQIAWFDRHWPLYRGISRAAMEKAVNKFITVERFEPRHITVPHLLALLSLLPEVVAATVGRRLVRLVTQLEDKLLYEDEIRLFARTVLIAGRMETQMGRTFNIRSTRSV